MCVRRFSLSFFPFRRFYVSFFFPLENSFQINTQPDFDSFFVEYQERQTNINLVVQFSPAVLMGQERQREIFFFSNEEKRIHE
jgi:hypothetical protein